MDTISPTPDTPASTPPPKRYGNRTHFIALGVYFSLLGIILLQNAYSFWPSTGEVDAKSAALQLDSNTQQIKIQHERLKKLATAKPPDSLRIDSVARVIERLNASNDSLSRRLKEVVAQKTARVRVLWWKSAELPLDKDRSLFMLVLIMGALGSWLHAVSSYLDFIGNRNFVTSWVPWYLMRPILGAILAVVFYLVLRAGLFPNDVKGIEAVNPFSIAALAGLVGLFTQRATKKLGDVFDALFPTAQKDKDPLSNKILPPKIIQFTPPKIARGASELKITAGGNNFTEKSRVRVNGKERVTTFKTRESLEFSLLPEDVAAAGSLSVTVVDPDAGDNAVTPVALAVE